MMQTFFLYHTIYNLNTVVILDTYYLYYNISNYFVNTISLITYMNLTKKQKMKIILNSINLKNIIKTINPFFITILIELILLSPYESMIKFFINKINTSNINQIHTNRIISLTKTIGKYIFLLYLKVIQNEINIIMNIISKTNFLRFLNQNFERINEAITANHIRELISNGLPDIEAHQSIRIHREFIEQRIHNIRHTITHSIHNIRNLL